LELGVLRKHRGDIATSTLHGRKKIGAKKQLKSLQLLSHLSHATPLQSHRSLTSLRTHMLKAPFGNHTSLLWKIQKIITAFTLPSIDSQLMSSLKKLTTTVATASTAASPTLYLKQIGTKQLM